MGIKILPGTTIELHGSILSVRAISSSLFLADGLTLAQVSSLTNLSPAVLQSWVRRGFLPPPLKKRYSEAQFFRIAIINILKDDLQLGLIVKLINYVNMPVEGAGAAVTDDTALYHYFVEALFLADRNIDKLDAAIETALRSFREPYPGARKRIAAVIRIMIILYISSQIKESAGVLLRNIGLK